MQTSSVNNQVEVESQVGDFVSLLKPRVMSLVVFTGVCGMLLAPGEIHPFFSIVAILCIALGSGAAGAINMWWERRTDALMERTKNRPLPAGRLDPASAIEFAVIVAFISVFTMSLAINYVAGALLAAAIAFYVFIYTIWLKPRTAQNIVIGGAAGAFPPMIGWAAVTGTVTVESMVLFTIIFMWTPPHFWALSLYRHDDYAKAGIPMLPVVNGNESTRKHIYVYTILLLLTTLLPVVIGMSGAIYGAGAFIIGVEFLKQSHRLNKKYEESKARKLFFFSISYLFLIFVLLVIDHWVL